MRNALHQVGRTLGGETHLDPMDLTFEDGWLTDLLGPVRAGKTSLRSTGISRTKLPNRSSATRSQRARRSR